ncbi:FHA domain-containing protein [Fischerella sp. PCC 9605]|uniref:FHA domain-containing protein n=1 Tax=Fischerella sp. PCC 9605 TaxID=1173024 RepID=UPI0004B03F9D|nr:FHA domain-containing protein [Fischerella sp. PCC 9605]
MAEFIEKELEKRLSLYQVFLKLYEHHSSFLDEILHLENVSQPLFSGLQQFYLQGVVDGSVVYAITNLCEGKTQTLIQPQRIWTIGRDRSCGIYISDQHVSRRHAAIQYIDDIDEPGFYLIDFTSKNGTYVNSEPAYRPIKLQDGDRIRLGSMTFSFFMNITAPQVLPTVAVELLMQLVPRKGSNEAQITSSSFDRKKSLSENLDNTVQVFRDVKLIDSEEAGIWLSKQRQSEILDDFFRRQIPSHS